MDKIQKPNDIFAAVLQLPDVNVFDLAKSNITSDNTQILSRDFYKDTEIVKNTFKDDKGNFDELAFDNAYNKALFLYNELSNDEKLALNLEWDPYDFTAPIGSRKYNITPTITNDFNPFKNLYSRDSIGSITENKLSLREIAQQNKVYDPIKNSWSEKSLNDFSLFEKFFGDTLVYAQWDEDTQVLDPLTGRIMKHKKGDWKFDDSGNLYIEKLGNREIYGKQVVNPMDILTTDGSVFNKVDFFDSDGKTKSIIGTTAKIVVEVAPFLIPGLNTWYGGYKAAKGLAFVLPTFYKSIEGLFLGDSTIGNETALWKAMNSLQGTTAKWNQRSTSDEASQSFFNYEQIGGLVTDVFSQIYEQRAAASLSKLFYKNKETEYIKTLSKSAEEQFKKLSFSDTMAGIKRSDETYTKIGQAASKKIHDLNIWEKKRSALAKSLSLSYMAMLQSSEVYSDALAGGYDRRTAGAAALMSASGQFALMYNNPLGDWFLDKTVGYTNEKSGFIKAFNKHISEKMPEIEAGVKTLSTNKTLGKNILGSTFVNIKNNLNNFINSANTATTLGKQVVTNAVIEGIEEVSEQAIMDTTKGIIDFMSYLGFTGKSGSFGGWSNVFSKEGLQNYITNFAGGLIGGAMFELNRSVPLILKGQDISLDTNYSVIDYVSNGKKDEFLKQAKIESQKYGNTALSPVGTDINGDILYMPSEGYSQADFIYDTIEKYVNNVDRILNSENVLQNDESWVRKAIIDEVKIQDMLSHNTDSFIISDIRELLEKVVSLKSNIEGMEKDEKDPKSFKEELAKTLKELESIQKGEKSDYYYGLSLFALNKNLHGAFISMDVKSYVKEKYNKDFDTLSEKEKTDYSNELKVIMENDEHFKSRMKSMYQEFLKYNEIFSNAFEEYGKDGYDVTRSEVFKALMENSTVIQQAVENKDIERLKALWAYIQETNLKNSVQGLPNMELNTSLISGIGKYLINNKIIRLGKSYKELSKELNVSPDQVDNFLVAQKVLKDLTLSTATPETTLKELWDQNSKYLTPEEFTVLVNTYFKNLITIEVSETGETVGTFIGDPNIKIKDILNEEVFNEVELDSLSEEESTDLINVIDSLLSSTQLVEKTKFQELLSTINQDNLYTSLNMDPESEGYDKVFNRKRLLMDSEERVINKKVFFAQNLGNYHQRLLDAISDLDSLSISTEKGLISLPEFIQNQKTLGLNTKDILMSIFSENKLTSMSNTDVEDILEKALEEFSSELDNQYGLFMVPKSFTEINDIIQKRLNESNKGDLTWIASIIDSTLEVINNLPEDEFRAATLDIITSKEAINSPWITNPLSLNLDTRPVINPILDILLDFSEDIISKGGVLDNEIIETAKQELLNLSKYTQSVVVDIPSEILEDKYTEKMKVRLNNIINYGNVKRNKFLDILRTLQLKLFNEPNVSYTIFDLLKELNQIFSENVSPSDFKISANTDLMIKRAKYTLQAAEAIIAAMMSSKDIMDINTMISEQSLYGFNTQFNKTYDKEGNTLKLGILTPEDTLLLAKEINLLGSKIAHFELLSESNMGNIIQEQKNLGNAINKAIEKRLVDANDPLSLLKLSVNGRTLLTSDDIEEFKNLSLETRVYALENRARENFIKIVNESNKSVQELLDELFQPFKELTLDNDFSLFDNMDSVLSIHIKEFASKDWYTHLHSILASSSIDFVSDYKKYLEKEVSLQDEFRAPFVIQRLVMQQVYGYMHSGIIKNIIAHSVDFLVPNLNIDNSTISIIESDKYPGVNVSGVFQIRGAGGTGKSDVIANFVAWLAIAKEASQPLGKDLEVVALGPTLDTSKIVEKGITRGNFGKDVVTVKSLPDYLKDMLKDTDYSTILEELGKSTVKPTDTFQEFEYSVKDGALTKTVKSGVFIHKNMVLFSSEKLELLLQKINIGVPQLLIIDELSQVNPLEYQILNYLVKHKNFTVVLLGDNLQSGARLGTFNFYIENILAPNTIKLKSTIRSENIHRDYNNVVYENFTNKIKRKVIATQNRVDFKENLIINYSTQGGFLSGDKFADILTVEDLKLFNPEQELRIITDDGTLDSNTEQMLINAFGENYKTFVTVSDTNVQGKEFKQVLVLAKIFEPNSNDVTTLNGARNFYTLMTRSKIATLVINNTKSESDGTKSIINSQIKLTHEVKEITGEKKLDPKDIKKYLEETLKDFTNILEDLKDMKVSTDNLVNIYETSKKEGEETTEDLDEFDESDEVEKPIEPKGPITDDTPKKIITKDPEIQEQSPIEEPSDTVIKESKNVIPEEINTQEIDSKEKATWKEITKDISGTINQVLTDLDKVTKQDIEESIQQKELQSESNKIKQDEENSRPGEIKDVKIIAYTNFVNIGLDIPTELNESNIKNWLKQSKSINSDFSAYVQSYEQDLLNSEDIVKDFKGILNTFISLRNSIVASIESEANKPNSNGVVRIESIGQNIDITTQPYIVKVAQGKYSQPFGNRPSGIIAHYNQEFKYITGDQLLLRIDININGVIVPFTLAYLSAEETATDPNKNKRGDINKLKNIYKKLNSNNNFPINLLGSIKLYTGVQSLTTIPNDTYQVRINADRQSIMEAFSGAEIISYGVFRGPTANDSLELNKASIDLFKEQLQDHLNQYNKTPIKIVDGDLYPDGNFPVGEEPYQKYMFRPFVIISYYKDNTLYQKIQLLYPKSRPLSEVWQKLESISDISTHIENSGHIFGTLISRYQSWQVIRDFISSELEGLDNKSVKSKLSQVASWINDIFDIQVYLSRDLEKTKKKWDVSQAFKQAILEFKPGKESFEEFFNKSIKIQTIIKNLGSDVILGKADINPLFLIESFFRNHNLIDNKLSASFKEFINTYNKPIYVNTRIISKGLDSKYGTAFGEFSEEDAVNYELRYYTEMPKMLLDLEKVLSNNVKKVIKETPRIEYNKSIFTFKSAYSMEDATIRADEGELIIDKMLPDKVLFSFDLTEKSDNLASNLKRIISNDTNGSQKEILFNHLALSVSEAYNLYKSNIEDLIDVGEYTKEGLISLDTELKNDINTLINKKLGSLNNVLNNMDEIPQPISENKYCKM